MAAFVPTLATFSSSASALHGTSAVCRAPPTVSSKSIIVAQAKRPTPQAPVETPFKRLEENRIAKEVATQSAERDYFPFAEQLNGRAAMMGFFIGVVTEAVTGKGIIEQLKIIFSPLL